MNFSKENMPRHIGLIMDGNRRWAKSKGKPIALGHKQGAETLEKITRYANKIGLEYLTVYAFSTENWRRPKEEVEILMKLLQSYIDRFSKIADSENVRVQFLGDTTAFSEKMQKGINDCINRTKNNTGVTLNILLNYGGRTDIINSIRKICAMVKNDDCDISEINEETVSANLYTQDMPDPDLIVRTSGEMRLSGFLTWQSVYSEILFIDKKWPDFSEEDLDNAIIEYQKRTRRFGAN